MQVRETDTCILAVNVGKGTSFHVGGNNACKEYKRLGSEFLKKFTY
jgi:hypothetical protein